MIKYILSVLLILSSSLLVYLSYSKARLRESDLERNYIYKTKLLDRHHVRLDSALAYIDSAKVEIDYKGDPLDRSKVPPKWDLMRGIMRYRPGYISCLRHELEKF
jgi:hypothetical protein